jgi:hypothetical protein
MKGKTLHLKNKSFFESLFPKLLQSVTVVLGNSQVNYLHVTLCDSISQKHPVPFEVITNTGKELGKGAAPLISK